MIDRKISQLPELTTPAINDLIPIVDVSVADFETKHIRVDNLVTGGIVAPADPQYVTLALHAGLPNERVLIGTANQVIVTDGGAGAAVTLSTPQDIHVGASPTFAGLTTTGVVGLGVAPLAYIGARIFHFGNTAVEFGAYIIGRTTGNATTVYGALFESQVLTAAGVVGAAYGFLNLCLNLSGATVSLFYAGFYRIDNTAAGIITNAFGAHIGTNINSGAGSITNEFGLFVANQNIAGTSYGIYTQVGQNSLGDDLEFRQAASITTLAGDFTINPLVDINISKVLNFDWAMGNSTKDPTTDAPDDWVQVEINDNVYYLPAYLV